MKQFMDYLVLSLTRSLCFILRVLPERIAYLISRGLFGLVLLIKPEFKRVAERNLELVFPEKSLSERKQILQDSFSVLARHIVLFARLSFYNSPQRFPKHLDMSELVEASKSIRSEGGGTITLTMHYGPFEFLQHCHSYLVGKTHILARGSGLSKFDTWWAKSRGRGGNITFPRRGGYKKLLEYLGKGEHVAMLVDQNVKSNHAVFVDFCGLKAATTKSYALAMLRTNAPLIVTYGWEDSPGFFKTKACRLPDASTYLGTQEEKVEKICSEVSQFLEDGIRAHPEQWFWIHKRFKTRPPGEEESLYADC